MRSARVAVVLSLLAAACFADLSGFSGGAADGGEGAPDASADAPATPPPPPPDGDSGGDAPGDACKPGVAIDAPFAADLGSFVATAYDITAYPRVESFGGDVAAVILPVPDSGPVPVDAGPDADGGYAIEPLEVLSAHSGLWWPTRVPLGSFDLDVEVKIQCTSSSSCADGLMIAWLDMASVTPLTNGNVGHTAGIPEGTAGAAVDLDDFRNDDPGEVGDPPAPTVQVIAFDPTKKVGTYPWIAAYASLDFRGAWHRVSVKMRGGAVAVSVDGATVVNASVPPVANGFVGLTAGTGGETDSVAVRNLHASFYACTP